MRTHGLQRDNMYDDNTSNIHTTLWAAAAALAFVNRLDVTLMISGVLTITNSCDSSWKHLLCLYWNNFKCAKPFFPASELTADWSFIILELNTHLNLVYFLQEWTRYLNFIYKFLLKDFYCYLLYMIWLARDATDWFSVKLLRSLLLSAIDKMLSHEQTCYSPHLSSY